MDPQRKASAILDGKYAIRKKYSIRFNLLVIFLELLNKQEKSCFSEVQNVSVEMLIS